MKERPVIITENQKKFLKKKAEMQYYERKKETGKRGINYDTKRDIAQSIAS